MKKLECSAGISFVFNVSFNLSRFPLFILFFKDLKITKNSSEFEEAQSRKTSSILPQEPRILENTF